MQTGSHLAHEAKFGTKCGFDYSLLKIKNKSGGGGGGEWVVSTWSTRLAHTDTEEAFTSLAANIMSKKHIHTKTNKSDKCDEMSPLLQILALFRKMWTCFNDSDICDSKCWLKCPS